MTGLVDVPTDKLDAALSYAGCPICRLRHDREMNFVANVLGDWVLAAMVRAEFIDALGYCVTHAWLQQSIEGNYRHDGRWRGWIKRRLVHEQIKADGRVSARPDCPTCRNEAASQEKHLAHFLKQFGDADLRQRYATSRGLCLPHLRAALLTAAPRESRLFLATTALERVADLIHLIEEYERKHIWNYRDEPKLAEEQNSWIRAVAFEVGEQIWAWKTSPIR